MIMEEQRGASVPSATPQNALAGRRGCILSFTSEEVKGRVYNATTSKQQNY
jgi:hypothetical protein